MIDQRIISDVCLEFGVDRDELLDSDVRGAIVTSARIAAILRLKEHFSVRRLAAILRLNPSAAMYHLSTARKLNVQRNAAACHQRRRAAEVRP